MWIGIVQSIYAYGEHAVFEDGLREQVTVCDATLYVSTWVMASTYAHTHVHVRERAVLDRHLCNTAAVTFFQRVRRRVAAAQSGTLGQDQFQFGRRTTRN